MPVNTFVISNGVAMLDSTLVNEVQPANAEEPIADKLLGRTTEAIDAQFRKAELPIELTV
jgi:hypothetical protein